VKSEKKALHVILGVVGRHSCQNFQEFAQIFSDFVKVYRDFAQISTDFHEIKTFGGALTPPAPPPPTPVMQHKIGVL